MFRRIYLIIKYIKEMRDVAMVYATLIVKGFKKFSEVPATISNQVKEILIALDAEHLLDD